MIVFWLLAFALAWGLTVPLAMEQLGLADFGGLPRGPAMLIGFAPAIAAVVAAAFQRRLRELLANALRVRAPVWVYALAVGLPILLLAAAFLQAGVTGAPAPRLLLSPQVAVFGLVWLVLAFGEEIGWRGYALPRLVQRHGFFVGATILGLVWCVWHYPRLYASPFVSSLEMALPAVAIFSLQIFLANYVICWLAVQARYAVLVPTLFHAVFNVVATIHPTAAMDPAITAGMGVLALAVLLLSRRRQPQPTALAG